jgi:hypothetical protein
MPGTSKQESLSAEENKARAAHLKTPDSETEADERSSAEIWEDHPLAS